MKYNLTLLIVTFLAQSLFTLCNGKELTLTSSPSTELPSNVTTNSTINDNHGSLKKLIYPSDQFDPNNSTNSTDPIIHYVDFNLTENYNTSNEFYVVRTNETDQQVDLNDDSKANNNETLIDQGKHMFNNFYNKVTHLVDYESLDTNILYNLWIPFISGFAVGLALLVLICFCRRCCRRCPCCRKVDKIDFRKSSKRGSKKLQSVDDNRYLLVSNHSDSEGV